MWRPHFDGFERCRLRLVLWMYESCFVCSTVFHLAVYILCQFLSLHFLTCRYWFCCRTGRTCSNRPLYTNTWVHPNTRRWPLSPVSCCRRSRYHPMLCTDPERGTLSGRIRRLRRIRLYPRGPPALRRHQSPSPPPPPTTLLGMVRIASNWYFNWQLAW